MALHALNPGTLLSEYRIIKLLGEGGFGLTYLALDTHLDKNVAIKEYMPSDFAVRQEGNTISPKSAGSQNDYDWGLKAFINEAKILAKFDDINIVRVNRFFEANGTAYLVMEYCEGGCLSDRFSPEKPMQEVQVQEFLGPIMNGLQLVHEAGVLHRDIKPDNIMFRSDGTPVLIDFGAARQAIGAKSRSITTIVTAGYAPIEQYSTKGKIGPWTDIYALAAVAYACLTGTRPEDATDRIIDDTVEPLVSNANDSNFLKALDVGLEVKPEERPQDLGTWYNSWESDKGKNKDYSQLNGLIEMAGADEIITPAEMAMILKQAKNLGLNVVKARDYVVTEALKNNWVLERIKEGSVGNNVVSEEKVVSEKPDIKINHGDSTDGMSISKSAVLLVVIILLVVGVALKNDLSNQEKNKMAEQKVTKEKVYKQGTSNKNTHRLWVTTSPSNASVTLLDVKPKYKPGVKVPAMSQRIRVKASGYQTLITGVDLRSEDRRIHIDLKRNEKKSKQSTSNKNTHRLWVSTSPSYASVTLLDVKPKYKPGVIVPAISQRIRVKASGYQTITTGVDLRTKDRRIHIDLKRNK